jgi:malonyl-CoA O-methyltransferase
MLRATQARLKGRRAVFYVCADAEYLPFAGHSLDGVFSNLALQWCINLDAVFAGIKRALKPGGRLVFSTFGPQTLRELKGAWAEVDHYSHVNEFYSPTQLQQFLQQAGFKNIRLESTLYSPRHASVWSLMHELKQLGAHHVMAGRNKKTTTRTALRQMLAAYEKHRIDGLIPATFEVISVSAEA